MNIKTTEHNNFRIHYIKTDKFKVNRVTFSFAEETKSNINYLHRKLLTELLIEYCSKYKTEREFFKKSTGLYNPGLSSNIVTTGPSNTLYIKLSFLNEEYTEEGMNLESLKLAKEFIFNPDFSDDKIDNIKRLAKKAIDDIDLDPEYKSIILARNVQEKGSDYACNPYFMKEELDKVTAEDLRRTYKRMLDENVIDVYCAGEFNEEFFEFIKEMFNPNPNKVEHYIPYKELELNKISRVEDVFNQSNLSIITSIKDITEKETKYIGRVYNYILGGSGSSKMFITIREKNSLCYSIFSRFFSTFSKLEIKAGIDADNTDRAVDLIRECLNEPVTEKELEKAKNHIISSINMTKNYSTYYISYMINRIKFGKPSQEKEIEIIKKLTVQEVNDFRKKIEVNTIFLLEGGQNA